MSQRDDDGNLYRPDACLCDINMPGIDLLNKLKAVEALQAIPITMLVYSDDERDIRMYYQTSAATYHCEPDNYQNLSNVIDSFSRYWFNTVSLPLRINLGEIGAGHH